MVQGVQPVDRGRADQDGKQATRVADDTLLLDEALALDRATAPAEEIAPEPAPIAEAPREALIETIAFEQFEEEAPPPVSALDRVPAILCALLALGWIGVVAAIAVPATPDARVITDIVALASGPLALIGILYLLSRRTSRREARRFAGTAEAIRVESARLERSLAILTQHVAAQRDELSGHRAAIGDIGAGATADLAAISGAIRSESETLAIHAAMLAQAAVSARSDMTKLMEDMPRAEAQARTTAGLLRDTGSEAGNQAAALSDALTALADQGRQAQAITVGAARQLADQVAAIEGATTTSEQAITRSSAAMGQAIDEALGGAAQAIDETRRGMRAQGDAMLALIEQSSAALDHAGAEAARSMATRLDSISTRLDGFATRLADQDNASRAVVERLDRALGEIERRLAAIGEDGTARTADLAEAIVTLAGHVDGISARLTGGSQAADALLAKAGQLTNEIDAGRAMLDRDVPAALAQATAEAQTAAQLIAAAVPHARALTEAATNAARSLDAGRPMIERQEAALAQLVTGAEQRFAELASEVHSLQRMAADTDAQLRTLGETTSAQLVESLLRVREAANQAAERAREAIGRVIPDSAQALAAASGAAMSDALGDPVTRQMAMIGEAAEAAVSSAHKATERLMRQMLTIADTTQQIETRINDAKAEMAAHEEEGFSRRVALLIESLNSTAIDVTKILSNDVTDAAWAAYLKGDRGVFTRRAVRLIDSGEAREILRHYEIEPEFREQVNRYIHDFEAMLRRILATRDGGPLGVTMLSSDMGKLYVALAQAIERLRG